MWVTVQKYWTDTKELKRSKGRVSYYLRVRILDVSIADLNYNGALATIVKYPRSSFYQVINRSIEI